MPRVATCKCLEFCLLELRRCRSPGFLRLFRAYFFPVFASVFPRDVSPRHTPMTSQCPMFMNVNKTFIICSSWRCGLERELKINARIVAHDFKDPVWIILAADHRRRMRRVQSGSAQGESWNFLRLEKSGMGHYRSAGFVGCSGFSAPKRIRDGLSTGYWGP